MSSHLEKVTMEDNKEDLINLVCNHDCGKEEDPQSTEKSEVWISYLAAINSCLSVHYCIRVTFWLQWIVETWESCKLCVGICVYRRKAIYKCFLLKIAFMNKRKIFVVVIGLNWFQLDFMAIKCLRECNSFLRHYSHVYTCCYVVRIVIVTTICLDKVLKNKNGKASCWCLKKLENGSLIIRKRLVS